MADNSSHGSGGQSAKDQGNAKRAKLNSAIAQRQKLLLGGIGAVALIAGSMFIFGGEDAQDGEEGGATTIDTGGLVNRNLSQREFVATYGNRLDAQGKAIKDLQESQLPKSAIEQELETLRGENARMLSDGQAAIDAISAENAVLRSELETVRANPPTAPVAPVDPRQAGLPPSTLDPTALAEPKASLLSFESEKAKASHARSSDGSPLLLLEASRDYLPPNSYAPATVIVGVDASTGVTSQSDPLPVVLRITGPARSVLKGNRLLTTDLTGCLVNGAARGDLSSEKVYVKLVRMTCAQPGGRYAVSEVKGFIAFAGKSGVRGRVVSREGSLVSQALLAGIVGGFGRGFSANANGVFAGRVGEDGAREALSPTDILAGGFGQGAGEAADTVSKYLIERAEQYQPVVEMPTGIAVEIVFLDGVHVRSTSQ
ncbi:TraB/VirB10 family protein [Erythrobacter sp. SCSIO 43205]|jgi:conjugal transfer pilus assembly protein TraB|uniref:TraB/VirB10 family protein n=1 Tax=Erythrobacteraceae TaxID=335929 RepID=UPI0004D983D2|nr:MULTISPECIES: TraB/VirB10 family protein [Erythrobacteraceae]KEO86799.1 conjugal transfer protein TraB [Erythrobacter sp. JL475]MCK0099600.1 TraB/VirB10 family protein [Qipengyuania sp. S6317L1]QIQ86426.1 MAG: conjugal transfer protein TraB [Erythrobacter sp.]UAB79249.1 TraB/VirB10 family protein [Erythrobacter sp. SCSIO 43205]